MTALRELAKSLAEKEKDYATHERRFSEELIAILDADDDVRREVECRLWDTQWLNIVNHENCYRDFDKETAIADAVRRTEDAMARNFRDDRWPPRKDAIQGETYGR